MVTVGVAIACFGALLVAVIACTGWSANRGAAERERQLVDNAFNRSIMTALNEQKSIAWWDDAVTKITDDYIDLEFVDANFGYFLTETYGHDEVYILNAENKPVFAFFEGERQPPEAYDLRVRQLAPVLREVRGEEVSALRQRPGIFVQGDYEFLSAGGSAARWGGHILSVEGRAAVVASMSLEPNVDRSLALETPYVLMSITYMDDEFVSAIGQSLLLPDLRLESEAPRLDGLVKREFIADDERRLGDLVWTTKRPGHVLLTLILPLTAIGIVLAWAMAFNMLRRLKRASGELAEREAQARYEAKHDALSGLPNRHNFVERLNAFLHTHGAQGSRAIAAYIDVDRFKDINDTLGHRAGDHLIKAASARLQARLREGDFLARFGGDEFAILCAPANGAHASALAERIALAFAEPFALEGQNIRVTASVGIAVSPENGENADDLMRHADIALYRAKADGRDRAVVFCREMAEEVEVRRTIELDLREALSTEQLHLHYQPILSCGSHRVVGLEALLRWTHPQRGEIGPSVFVPIAEDSGLMPALGEWILDRAMRDSLLWPDLEIAINLSPVQIRHMDLPATLRRLSTDHGIDPSRFVLEITEGVLLDADDHSRRALSALRDMGFKTSLDDFGTGYSSLSYLVNFKFDKIKIDRSFVTGKSQTPISKTIVQAVATLGRGLGMSIVAEGVETEIDALMMQHLGCTEMQGYFFSRPLPRDEVAGSVARINGAAEASSHARAPLERAHR